MAADTNTSDKTGAVKQGTGNNENTWGTKLNDEVIDPFAKAIAGYIEKDVAGSSDVTLTASEAHNAMLKLTGALTGNINLIVPDGSGKYLIHNATSGSYTVTVKTSAGSGVTVTQGEKSALYCDGTNVLRFLQSDEKKRIWCGTAGGTNNAITLTPDPAIDAYELGKVYSFKAGSSDSDNAVTIAISGLSPVSAEQDDTAFSASVVVKADKYYDALYDGSALQVTRLSPDPASSNMRPNLLINGHMLAAQRGTSFTGGTANADDTYTLDRWYNLAEGNDSVDITQASDSPDDNGFSYAMDVETTGEKFGLAHIVEADNCIGAIGNTVTLSFAAKVSNVRIDTVKAAIISWSGTADSVTSDFISSWNADGTTPTLIANATFENTPADFGVTTSWATYSVSASVDTASAKNIIVFIWSDDATNPNAGDFLYVTNVKLEVGPDATDFTPDEKTVNLAKCQRYYFRYTADGSNDYLNCLQAYSTSGAQGRLLNLPVTMRTNGTTQLSATGDITMSDSGFSFAAASSFTTGAKRDSIYVNSSTRTGSGLTAGDSVSIILSDTKWVSVDAEL